MIETQSIKGHVFFDIVFKDGHCEKIDFPNTVLTNGKRVAPLVLANQIGDRFDYYITKMLFGDGGTDSGTKKYVAAGRNGLFGTTRLAKPVVATIDNLLPSQVNFTAVVKFEDAVGVTLNEMALQMSNGDLYSMTTFSDLTKTDEMQLTITWSVYYL